MNENTKNHQLPLWKVTIYFHEYNVQHERNYSTEFRANFSQLNGGKCNMQNADNVAFKYLLQQANHVIRPKGKKSHFHNHATPKKLIISRNRQKVLVYPENKGDTITTADNSLEQRWSSAREIQAIINWNHETGRLPKNLAEVRNSRHKTPLQKEKERQQNLFHEFLGKNCPYMLSTDKQQYMENFLDRLEVCRSKKEVYEASVEDSQIILSEYREKQSTYKKTFDQLKKEVLASDNDAFAFLEDVNFLGYCLGHLFVRATRLNYKQFITIVHKFARAGTKIHLQEIPEPKKVMSKNVRGGSPQRIGSAIQVPQYQNQG